MTTEIPVRPRVAIMRQQWRDIAFLHWRVDPTVVAPLLPRGTEPDVFDGSSWVGLIPFRMVGAGIGRGPAIAWLGSFAETNVRLYSVDAAGRHGVVFLSLEAQRLAVVLGARAVFAIPYMWSRMQVTRDTETVTYTTSRRWPRSGGAERGRSEGATITVRPERPIPHPDGLATFLTARWGLHTRIAGRLFYVPNHHEPWPLREASVLRWTDNLITAAGLPAVVGPPESVLFSTGVITEFGVPFPAA